MRLLERFTWLHVLIISLIGGALVGVAVHFMQPGTFTTTTSVLLNDRPDILATVVSGAGASGSSPISLERLKAILVSRALRERVADELSLTDKMGLGKADVIEALMGMTTVKSIGEDGLSVTVTVGGYAAPHYAILGTPLDFEAARQLCAQIANAYITELTEYLRDVSGETAHRTREFLQKRHDDLRDELDAIEDRMQSLRAQYELLDPESKAARLSERIRTLEQARADAAAEASAAAGSLETAEAELHATDARRVASAVETRNPVIASLEQELARLRIDLATQLAAGKTAQNRDVVQVQSSIDSIEGQMAALEEKVTKEVGEQANPLYDEAVKRAIELRIQLAGARARGLETESLLAAARGQMAEMPAVAREYVEIQRRQQVQSEQLASVERALWLAEFDQARTETGAPFTILDRATAPDDRKGPATLLAGLIAFAALMVLQGLLLIDRRWFGG